MQLRKRYGYASLDFGDCELADLGVSSWCRGRNSHVWKSGEGLMGVANASQGPLLADSAGVG